MKRPAQPRSFPANAVATRGIAARGSARRRSIAQESSWPAHAPPRLRVRTPEPVAEVERRPPRPVRDGFDHATGGRRSGSAAAPTTTAYAAEASAPQRADPCNPPVAAPATTATPIRQQSDMVSASLADEIGGGDLRPGSGRRGRRGRGRARGRRSRPTSPPCWWRTTSRSRFTIGPKRAGSSTSRNEAWACRARVSTPTATIASPMGRAAGPRPATLPDRGQEPVGVGDDEPCHRQGEDDAEDARRPARPEVHARSIVVRR